MLGTEPSHWRCSGDNINGTDSSTTIKGIEKSDTILGYTCVVTRQSLELLEACVSGYPTVVWEWVCTNALNVLYMCLCTVLYRSSCVLCWLYQWVREGCGAKPREEYACCLISSKLQISVALASPLIHSWRYKYMYTTCSHYILSPWYATCSMPWWESFLILRLLCVAAWHWSLLLTVCICILSVLILYVYSLLVQRTVVSWCYTISIMVLYYYGGLCLVQFVNASLQHSNGQVRDAALELTVQLYSQVKGNVHIQCSWL